MNTVVDAVEGLGESAFGGVYFMGGEEVLDLIALVDAAEGTSGRNDTDAGVCGELGVNFVPVLLNVGPGLVPGFAVAEEDGEDDPAVLVADLAGDGLVEGAGNEGWIGKVSECAERVGLLAGIAGILAGGEDLVVEGGVAVA
jgi:hypothetical protein